jgi:hypothetical protein
MSIDEKTDRNVKVGITSLVVVALCPKDGISIRYFGRNNVLSIKCLHGFPGLNSAICTLVKLQIHPRSLKWVSTNVS